MTLQTPVKILYLCNSAGLPGPLPTPDEIQHATRSVLSPRRHGWGSSGVCGGGLPDPVFGTMSPDNNINGPFKTDEEFSSALALALRNNWEQNSRYGWLSGYLSRHVPTALKGYRVTLTHGDLHMRNILV